MKLHTVPFLGSEFSASLADARFVILPVPYEGGVSYGTGAAAAPQAVLEASRQLEVYDSLLDAEPWRAGIATVAPLVLADDPDAARARLHDVCAELLGQGKYVILLGGDHSLSPVFCSALVEAYPSLGVVQLDAHADLRAHYEGSPFSHACALARIREMTSHTVQAGIRSMAPEEAETVRRDRLALFTMQQIRRDRGALAAALDALPDPVFLTVDVDVLDWSVVWSTGTPEPGGMLWDEALGWLRTLFTRKRVVGFDMVELAVREGDINSPFAVAKLLYHAIGLAQTAPSR